MKNKVRQKISLNDIIKERSKIIREEIQDDSIWEMKPVSPKEFFDKWLKSPLYPIQQKAVDSVLVVKKEEEYEWNKEYNEAYLLWGEGCISEDTKLKDEKTGKIYIVKELSEKRKSILIKSLDVTKTDKGNKYKIVNKRSGIPFKKGNTELFKVITKTGKEIIVSKEHKFLTVDGWKELNDLKVGNKIAVNQAPSKLITKRAEKLRREKISNTMKDIKKSLLHCKHIKESNNLGRFKRGIKPWNVGIPMSHKIKRKLRAFNLGKKLSIMTRKKIGQANIGMKAHKINCNCSCCKTMRNGAHTFWHRRKYKNINMRSSWEVKYAKYLDDKGIRWQYEPKRFYLGEKLGYYFPDFYLPMKNEYVEIKGLINRKFIRRMKEFKKRYYTVKLTILYKENLQMLGIL